MPNFSLPTGPYVYRPLTEGDQGWDVYALQTGINHFGELNLTEDGVFGPDTKQKVTRYQRNRNLLNDGVAGIVTQRSVALGTSINMTNKFGLATGHLRGQIEKESGFQLGNHTPLYSNGSRDLGVVQRNDRYAEWADAFDVANAIKALASRIRENFDTYLSYGKVSRNRCWELAAGSWNAPSWTATLAKGGSLSAANLQWINAYIDRVTVYVTSWPVK